MPSVRAESRAPRCSRLAGRSKAAGGPRPGCRTAATRDACQLSYRPAFVGGPGLGGGGGATGGRPALW